jgi:hypothetical protein
MNCVHRFHILLLDDHSQILGNIWFGLSFSKVKLLASSATQAIAQEDLHLSRLTRIVSIRCFDNSVGDILRDAGFEEIVEFSAFSFVVIRML